MIRTNTELMARGMVVRGFSASPAATAADSTPMKENPATMSTENVPDHPSTKGAAPVVQFDSPASWPPMRPTIIATPRRRKTMMVMTLIPANQNSDSPKMRAENRLSARMIPRKSTLHSREGESGNQYFMMMEEATSSTAMVIAHEYQYIHPTVKPSAGSTYLPV